MNLWQKLTIDWLCMLGDWLWANLVLPLKAGLDRLTFKRVVYLAALMLAFYAFAQIVSFDLAFVWAGDTAFYFEIASAVMLFAARGYARQTAHMITQKIRAAARSAADSLMRTFGARQRRNANAMRRKKNIGGGKRSDDEPAAGGLYVLA
jgi:hypothetical protein